MGRDHWLSSVSAYWVSNEVCSSGDRSLTLIPRSDRIIRKLLSLRASARGAGEIAHCIPWSLYATDVDVGNDDANRTGAAVMSGGRVAGVREPVAQLRKMLQRTG